MAETTVGGMARTTGAGRPQVPRDLAHQVGDALAHLHDPAYLQSHPLTHCLVPSETERGTGPRSGRAGHALRKRLEEAIAALEPAEEHRGPANARAGRLLRLRYLDGLEPVLVQRELGVSRAQFYRDRARAMRALVSLLTEQLAPAQAGADGAAVEEPVGVAPVPVEAIVPAYTSAGSVPGARQRGAQWLHGFWSPAADHATMGARTAVVLMSLAWGAAWFSVWTAAQTVAWPVAWAIGGAIGGGAVGGVLRLASPLLGPHAARGLALGWAGAWFAAWILGWGLARALGSALAQGPIAGLDPDSVGYGVGRVAVWAGAGVFLGAAHERRDALRSWAAGRARVAPMAVSWAAAGAIGHLVFWGLGNDQYAPGIRFALSGVIEGAVGSGLMLWLLGRFKLIGLFGRTDEPD